MPRPRPKVESKIPPISERILKNSTGEQLSYMQSLSSRDDFRLLLKIVSDLKDYNVYQVFTAQVRDDHELALIRAACRGEVAGLDALLFAFQGAKFEVDRRKREKLK